MTQKIDIGRVIEGTFELYRDHAAVLLPVAAVLFLIEAVLSGLLIEIAAILVIVAIMVQWAITYLYQGTVVSLVNDVQDGRRDFTVVELFKSVTPVLLTLIVAALLGGLAVGIGFLLLIVPGVFLITIWAVVAPAIVIERRGIFAAFGRSQELVRGNFWQVLAVIVIFFLILLVVGFVLGIIGALAGGVGRVILEYIGSVLTAPLVALAASVLYFNLRAAKGEAPAPGGQLDATGGAGAVPAGQQAAEQRSEPVQQPAEGQPRQGQPPAQGQPPPEGQPGSGPEQPRPGQPPPSDQPNR